MIDLEGMSPRAQAHLMNLVEALNQEKLLADALYGPSVDGGSVFWHKKSLFCYTITAEDWSDEIAELDGGYILVQVLGPEETRTETFMDKKSVISAIRSVH